MKAKSNAEYFIEFGALCHPIAKQLKRQKVKFNRTSVEGLQECADAITRLAVHQLLSKPEAHKARKRLMKKVTKTLRDANA